MNERDRATESEARKLGKATTGSVVCRHPSHSGKLVRIERSEEERHAIDVQETKAIVVSMGGAYTRSKETNDPTDVLNSVCHEGWELITGSFVFLERGSESRDKFMASGQQIAVKGTIIGYYLFKRSEADKREMQMPWETEQDEAPRLHDPQPVGAQNSAPDGHDLGTSS